MHVLGFIILIYYFWLFNPTLDPSLLCFEIFIDVFNVQECCDVAGVKETSLEGCEVLQAVLTLVILQYLMLAIEAF